MNKIEEEHGYLIIRSDFISEPKDHKEVTIKHMKGFSEWISENYTCLTDMDGKFDCWWNSESYTTEQLIEEYIKTLSND